MKLPLTRLKQILASVLSSFLVLTSFPASNLHAAPLPSGIRQLQLPERLGIVTESYRPDAAKRVILIQDLHLHYPTQQRILRLLQHLESKQILTGKLAVEGLQGDYDTSNLATLPAGKSKEKLVDYFLRKGELSGDEAFAVLRGESHRLFGVDDANYYQLNRELYKATFQSRKALQAHLAQVQNKLTILKKEHYTAALRRLDRKEIYEVASAEENLKAKLAIADGMKDQNRALVIRHIAEIDHSLYFLTKLLHQQTTLEEVRYLAQRLPHFVQLTQSLLKLEKSSWTPTAAELEETLKSAVDFYAVALMRDKPLADNTLHLLQNQSNVILVAGGFHTAGVIDEFKKAGVGYIVITPNVTENIGEEYHQLYEKRVIGETLSAEDVARDFKIKPAMGTRSMKILSPVLALTASARNVVQTAWRGVQGRTLFVPAKGATFANSHAFRHALSARLAALQGWRPNRAVTWIIGAAVIGTGLAYSLGWIHSPQDALKVVGESMAAGGMLPIPSPFKTHRRTLRRLPPSPVKGVSPALFSGERPRRFSLMEAETVAAAASMYKQGLIGLAGRIKNIFPKNLTTQEDVVNELQKILTEHGAGWKIPRATQKNIVDHARKSKKFETAKPFKLVITAIKDVADGGAMEAVKLVNRKVAARSTHGMGRFFGASEGPGRDEVPEGEAFEAGQMIRFHSTRTPSDLDELISHVERRIGVQQNYYTIVDNIEGTNAAVGVEESGVAYKPGDTLPPGVQIIDISGATSVSLSVSGVEQSDLDILNAYDGYAHVLAASVPADKRAQFDENPLDPDQPEDSLKRIQEAVGSLKPQEVEVITINREREREKIKWLSDHGYTVSLIPDGTLMPSLYAYMMGRLKSGKFLVVDTTSGAPESRWGQAAEKVLSPFGAVGGVRIYPKAMGNVKEWMGKVGLTDEELTWYKTLQHFDIPKKKGPVPAEIAAFDKATTARGSFSFAEIKTYQDLHPKDWEAVVQLKVLYVSNQIQGNIDGAASFITDNKVFKESGVRAISETEVEVRVLRIADGMAWIETIQGDVDALANGDAMIGELDELFEIEAKEMAAAEQVRPVTGGSGEFFFNLSEAEILEDFKDTPGMVLTFPDAMKLWNVNPDDEQQSHYLRELLDGMVKKGVLGHNGSYYLKTVRDENHDFDVLGGQELRLGSDPLPAIKKYLPMPANARDLELLTKMARDYDFRSRSDIAPSPKLWFIWGATWAKMALERAKKDGITSRDVVLARDTRKLDPELIEALAAGLAYAGLNVIYVGQETPNAASSYSTALAEYRPLMGIFVTSSHVTSKETEEIRGAKVSIQTVQAGRNILASLTTQEIKSESREIAANFLNDQHSLEGQRASQPGTWRTANPNATNLRWNTLVGRIAAEPTADRDLQALQEDYQNNELTLDQILSKWEDQAGSALPLQGMYITVDGAHTPTGSLSAAALSKLGARIDLINGDVQALSGMHKADPSKLENLEELIEKMKRNGSTMGIAFDLDGDRVTIIVKNEKGEYIDIPSDNLIAALLPFLKKEGGFDSAKTGKRYAIIREILSTRGVDDVAAREGFQVEVTDSGYVFLKLRALFLLLKKIIAALMGERSGHIWQMGAFENPIEVAVTYAVMAMKYKQDHPESDNPFYEVYRQNTVPYLQATRFTPPLHEDLLKQLEQDFGAEYGWTYKPGGDVDQRIIAQARHRTIQRAAEVFVPGKEFDTPAGRLKVSKITNEDPSERTGDGLLRYVDIDFVDENGISAGHFVIRASANDPAFVTTYETKVRNDGKDELRFLSIGGIGLSFLENEKLAYVEGSAVKDKNTLLEAKRSLEPYKEYLAKNVGQAQDERRAQPRANLLFPGSISNQVRESLDKLQNEKAGEKMIAGSEGRWENAGLFAEIGKDPAPRLGWVQAAKRILANNLLALTNTHSPLAILQKILATHPKYVIFSGMGGSSLAIKLLLEVFGQPKNGPRMFYLDTTDPTALRKVQEEIYRLETGKSLPKGEDFTPEQNAVIEKALKENTQAVAITKSATTAETLSHMRFLAGFGVPMWLLTDPQKGTDPIDLPAARRKVLDVLAAEKIQMSADNIFWIELDGNTHHGGRFSAPATNVFLVAAAMIGLNLEQQLQAAEAFTDLENVHRDPFVQLAATLDALDKQGKDQLTFLLPKELKPFASWVEQLIEESVGKNGRGITIFYDEDLNMDRIAPVDRNDRVFITVTFGGQHNENGAFVDKLREGGYPIVNLDLPATDDVRSSVPTLMYGFERMVAAFAYLQGINFVNQPGVQNYKTETKEILKDSPVHLPVAKLLASRFGQWTLNIDELISNGVFSEAEIRERVEQMGGDVEKAEHVYVALLWLAEDKGLKNGEFALFGTAPEELMQTLRDARTEIFNDLQQKPGKVGRREQDNHSTEQNKGAGKPGTFSTFLVTEQHPKPIVGEYSDDVIKASAIGTVRSRTKQGRTALLLTAERLDDLTLKDLKSFFDAVADTLRNNAVIPKSLSGPGRVDGRFSSGSSITARVLGFITVLAGSAHWGISTVMADPLIKLVEPIVKMHSNALPLMLGAMVLAMAVAGSGRISRWFSRFREARAERRRVVNTMTPAVQKMEVPAMEQVQPETVPTPPSGRLFKLIPRWIPIARRAEAGSALSRTSRLLVRVAA